MHPDNATCGTSWRDNCGLLLDSMETTFIPVYHLCLVAMSVTQMQTAEESLQAKLNATDAEVLDVSVSMSKPVFTVTVRGTSVDPDVFDACRKFGYDHVSEVRQSTFTPKIGECMTIVFIF